jgi:hypothetical protein
MKRALVLSMVAARVFVAAAELHPDKGLTVHEWGTFTSVAGEDGAGIEWNVLGCKSDLPGFVIDRGYRNFKVGLSGTVRMETPVMYFYSSRDVTANVKVQFPQGTMTEWYPNADGAPGNVGMALGWSNVKVQPGAAEDFPVEKGSNRYYAARATDAAPLTVGEQHEKFLFYRGVGSFPIPLSVRVSGYGQVTVENGAGLSVPQAILFDNHDGRVRFSVAGRIDGTSAVDEPALHKNALGDLRKTIENALVAHGLFPKEARAMLDTWNDSWFEEGSRLIYIVPSAVVDEMLPLHIDPAPAEIARAFVGRIELVTPETERAVESAVARNDWAEVDRYSRFLRAILERMYPGNGAKVAEIEQGVVKFQATSGGGCR